MKLLIWLFICAIQIFSVKLNILLPLINGSHALHQKAINYIDSQNSTFGWFYKAILFGEDVGIRQKPEIKAFIVLGVYHIIVVSGSHLVFIEKFLSKVLKFLPQKVIFCLTGITLFLFSSANRWQPACLRSFIHWIFKKTFQNKNPLSADIQTSAVIFCLILKPDLSYSLSFQLSCVAALAISVIEEIKFTKNVLNHFLSALICTLLTGPLLFNVQPCLSWLILPANTLLMEFIQIIIFPLSFINFALPFVLSFTEPVLKLLFEATHLISYYREPEFCFWIERSSPWGMYYVFLLFFVWRLALPFFLRRKFQQNQHIL